MATAMAVSDQQLQAELQDQQKQLGRFEEKLRAERRRLEAASVERGRIVDAVERGETGKQSDLSRAKDAVEEIEIRVGGLQKNITPIEARIGELKRESDRRQAAAAKAARERAFTQLQEEGGAIAAVIVEKLMLLTTEEIAVFDRIRIRLGVDYRDMNGAAAADQLAALLFRPSQKMERARDPNIHNRLLEDRGWVFAGKPGPSYTKIPSAINQFGNPLILTVQSMRPRE